MNHSIENMKINVSTVFSGVALAGMMAIGWYANATDEKIEKVTEAAELAIANTTENAAQIRVILTIVETNQNLVKEAAADARTNREALIRIEAQTKRD